MMQRRSATSAPPDAILSSPGGFAWWYVDLVDDRGDGLVLIFSWGLPFLPGLARAARDGAPTRPAERPALCFSLYEGGRCTAYLLQEHDPADASTDLATRFTIGGSELSLRADGCGRLSLRARLDCPIPGEDGRITGIIEAEGPLLQAPADETSYPAHSWAPRLAGVRGEARLDLGGRPVQLQGALYHDRNDASAPLHAHGIGAWWWARLSLPDRTLIWYQLRSNNGYTRHILMDAAPDGIARLVEAPGAVGRRWRPHLFGPASPSRLTLPDADGGQHAITIERPIDDSPFYQRFRLRGAGGWGWLERVLPAAVDPDWMRPLVQMRVHKVSGSNSFWLPLFNGPAESRLPRLLGLRRPGLLEAR